ncbi:MAG: ABC transporter ATP-binding protein [Pseudomonadota bacterium]
MSKAKSKSPQAFFAEDGTYQIVRRLLVENFKGHGVRYGIAFFFMAVVAATTALSAWIMKDVVESLFINRDLTAILSVGLAVMAIFIVKGAASYGQIITLARVGNAIVAKLQMRLYDRVLMQSGDFYARYPSNDLVTRIAQNAQGARMVIDMVVTSLGRDLLTLIGLVIVMILQDPFLSLVTIIIGPPTIIVVTSLVRRVRAVAKQRFFSDTQIISTMQETVRGIKIVKAFAMEPAMRARMGTAVSSVEDRTNKISGLAARTSPLMETLGGLCIGLVIIYAGWHTTEGQSPAQFMAFLTALLFAYEPAKRIARLQVNLENGLVGARLMYEILDTPLAVQDREGAHDLMVSAGEVALDDVSFSYPTSEKERDQDIVLDRISFTAEGGGTTALIGPSGSGKTTIINLIQRFYDVDAGRISIDGQDISGVTLSSLRNTVALVSQETFLFAGTVRENILAGKPDADEAALIRAAKVANAHDFIVKLDNGYDTDIGENGDHLSGGQRQRIAIARAVLKNAPILLLDEATSALDTESERLVQDAFDKLMEGRTTIVIAHRLSTIRNADCIHVLKDGHLVESGKHAGLMLEGNVYKHLHDLQFSDAEGEAAE